MNRILYFEIKMTELKINYNKTCACIPAGIEVSDSKYKSLVTSSIVGSLSASETPEFQARFKDSPDNIETQVDMYGALLDDVCARLSRGVERIETDKTKVQSKTALLTNIVRSAYALTAFSEIVPLEDGTALFAAYFQDKLGDKKPTKELIEKTVEDYISKLKVKEFLDAQGITNQVIANLEASLL